MLYIVAVPIAGDDLVEPMNRMRVWLDHHGFEPDSFRLDHSDANGAVCRVSFKSESAAAEFARAFAGTLLGPTADTALVQA
jgi:hypothetical protein